MNGRVQGPRIFGYDTRLACTWPLLSHRTLERGRMKRCPVSFRRMRLATPAYSWLGHMLCRYSDSVYLQRKIGVERYYSGPREKGLSTPFWVSMNTLLTFVNIYPTENLQSSI